MAPKSKRAREAEAIATSDTGSNGLDITKRGKQAAQAMLDFINFSWTPFHAVEEASRRLMAAGYQHLRERDAWSIQPGGRYFFTRNQSTIVAFAVGEKYKAGNGFFMVGAHTDSPCLKLKPVSTSTKSGYLMVNVETYGGGLWYTWYDRDLGLAGRVLLRDASGGLTHRLVKVSKPVMRIPMLAIHLQRDIHTAGFKPNLHSNFAPMLASVVKAQLEKTTSLTAAAPAPMPAPPVEAPAAPATPAPLVSVPDVVQSGPKHHSLLLAMLASELSCDPKDIVDFELHVCDVQAGTLGGLLDEFVYCGRLDNLACSYTALQALIETTSAADALAEETGIRAVALFDHEEVGSESAQGAGGPVMRDTITRVASSLSAGQEGAVERTLRSSYLVSADMAHALHPNYSDKHDSDHAPRMHGGLVLKYNHNQRYATDAVGAILFREVGRRANIPVQEFSVRNDMPCGSTIGPILSSNLGCRTVDVGIPQLSMHSIREMCGTDDIAMALDHFKAFYTHMSSLESTLDVDALPPPAPQGTLDDVPCPMCHK